MKKHFAITVSDYTGSRYFSIKSTTVRNVIILSVLAFFIVVGSFGANLILNKTVISAAKERDRLNGALLEYDRRNAELAQIISNHERQLELISAELVKVEKISGVDTGDLDIPLAERIKLIGQFYNAKEAEYSHIGSRIEQIEAVMGLDGQDQDSVEMGLSDRVELASLTVTQKRILHDSIPNGYPMDQKTVTSHFGMRKHPITKINSFHKGVDIGSPIGGEVYATADGFVSHSDYSNLTGNKLVLMHNFGFETRYYHLDKFAVAPGDIVHKGDLIAYSGNTGRSNGPHLHYEIRYLGHAIDPREFLKWEFGTNEIFTQVRGIKWLSLINLISKQITHQMLQLSLLDRTSQEK